MSGIEVVSLVLGVFPLVISLLEHYQDGYDTLRDFAHFRREFTHLVNELNREQIIFRQHVEGTLRSITESEFELKEMMDNLQSERWKRPELAQKMQQKLCGKGEFENYQASMLAIHGSLSRMSKRLTAFEISQTGNTSDTLPTPATGRLQQRFRKLHFIIRKKRWREQIVDLGRQIDRVGKLFGAAEALAPARQSRASATHLAFEQIRNQASSLHQAIIKALTCGCDPPHVLKLIMAKRSKGVKSGRHGPSPPIRTLKVSFPLCPRPWTISRETSEPKDSWRTFDTTMVSPPGTNSPFLTGRDPRESRSSISSSSTQGQSSLFTLDSGPARTIATTTLSSTSSSSRNPFLESPQPYPCTTALSSATAAGKPLPIADLCGAIREGKGDPCIGYLKDGQGSHHIFSSDPAFSFTSADIDRVITLEAMLTEQGTTPGNGGGVGATVSRRRRMSIALSLAYALIELHPTPWVPRFLGKMDVYFFQRKDGEIMTDNPFFLCELSPQRQPPLARSGASEGSTLSQEGSGIDHSNALLALGIVIMELWFGQTIESRSFYRDHCDEKGNKKAFTNFTAALEWQRKTIDEAGVTLHDITNRCIRGNFGESVLDLNSVSCTRAVHDQVVKPLEGMLGYIWPTVEAA